MNSDTLQQVIHELVRSNVRREKIGSRYNIQAVHGLRKRFATIVKMDNRISYSVSERLLGHQAYLDKEYMRPTKDQLFQEFLKVIDGLTVDDSERKNLEIMQLKEKAASEIQNSEIKDLALWLDKNPHLFEATKQVCELLNEKILKHLPPYAPDDPTLRADPDQIRI